MIKMKWIQTITALTTGLCLSVLPSKVLAQTNFYPLDTRAGFMTGCLLEDPPNLGFNQQVYGVMRVCLCMLDKFQEVYSHEEFNALSQGYEANREPQVRELQGFVSLNLPTCEAQAYSR